MTLWRSTVLTLGRTVPLRWWWAPLWLLLLVGMHVSLLRDRGLHPTGRGGEIPCRDMINVREKCDLPANFLLPLTSLAYLHALLVK